MSNDSEMSLLWDVLKDQARTIYIYLSSIYIYIYMLIKFNYTIVVCNSIYYIIYIMYHIQKLLSIHCRFSQHPSLPLHFAHLKFSSSTARLLIHSKINIFISLLNPTMQATWLQTCWNHPPMKSRFLDWAEFGISFQIFLFSSLS